ncbi:amino acid ABC transporter ATP-binding protein [Bradyrhizobium diazoefficiens]|nr:amino acid ABC transporter ATP-binding protein [Bradyrhizobium diazoefficiens]MBR0965669.1 amino acid ABC transporter ATP-binding protein [Bradyrhizobium diazoefficiens]MBR0979361.1 amino acid ABC transporter ATP-binding protein [Bradyrhizobium diazoefficiens]MBR1008553.1 amino acid ABC transporter ATP-binding protein [Bradyrhizobium diazoefficiens]MBR1014698.1 amino acid ABC transporter ATP-binding protein [Bradyrhizobium diazoefficiens]MBR1052514.1 amino acid ABC transporter ATP-binding p
MIAFSNVYKYFGRSEVLTNISLSVQEGTMCVICGPSGAGKSTLLGTVNGLEPIDRGEIWVAGRRVGDPSVKMRDLRTQIGVVYQSFNLFPHLTVERNIRLGLEKGLGLDRAESIRRAHCELERLGLLAWRDALPAHLSGGQQQRVAIARCLAMKPKILLLDEPTSALDVDNAMEVVGAIRSLASHGITILLSTHQISLFCDIADYLVCLEAGQIVEQGCREQVLAEGCPSKLNAWIGRLQAMNGRAHAPAANDPSPVAQVG